MFICDIYLLNMFLISIGYKCKDNFGAKKISRLGLRLNKIETYKDLYGFLPIVFYIDLQRKVTIPGIVCLEC
ncbi:hypothetical protein Lsai_3484 [Legionella sainthelensi]|uniref:Uncharacterized protein n=1 Tax=Legionella sainthelensi TaxID=28087 RepID=A0A0W0YDI0_9GAMM|nr:hypothetical protein Lsai_3484 [Legionella sainthelensi]VEH33750.1 Uncharacterised protein [Legionella sainthelensi]